jgi:putative membrane protein
VIQNIIAFLSYLGTAIVLLAAFITIYVQITPYKEFKLIAQGNAAAAISLAGAILGFSFPLVSSIYYTQSLLEMSMWAGITCVVQLLVFMTMRHWAKQIENGVQAPAITLAALSISVGLLNAVSISH